MKVEPWKAGVRGDVRPDGVIRHSQVTMTFGPGALADLVDDAAIVAGLGYWAKGDRIVEDRLLAMLARQKGFEKLELYWPPSGGKEPSAPDRKWIKAFRFPQWFVCLNERCWEDAGKPPSHDKTRPRRLLRIGQLDSDKHRCDGKKAGGSKVLPVRFTRACPHGHIDDIDWVRFLHRDKADCPRAVLWLDEVGASGDLADVRLSCSTCQASLRMSAATLPFSGAAPTLGFCEGKRLWLGDEEPGECGQPMRFLLRSASHAYFPAQASVIHIPDLDASVRDKVSRVFDTLKNSDEVADVAFFRRKVDAVRNTLEGLSDELVFAELQRRREDRPVAYRKVKEAELDVFLGTPEALNNDRFSARTLVLPAGRSPTMQRIDSVVLLPRLTEVRALAGFTRFEPQTADKDGELDLGAKVARLDEPLTWLPAVENQGEGFFFSLSESALARWEAEAAVQARQSQFQRGFSLWQGERDDRKMTKADFATARFVLLHSLSHLLITAVSLECGYSASAIRERVYVGSAGSGVLLYTAAPGAEGSLGGLVEVGKRLDRYLRLALDLARLCSNDPVCASHQPADQRGGTDRHLEGASCHGCLLICEPSCERMNHYLDRALVVPTVVQGDAAFFDR